MPTPLVIYLFQDFLFFAVNRNLDKTINIFFQSGAVKIAVGHFVLNLNPGKYPMFDFTDRFFIEL